MPRAVKAIPSADVSRSSSPASDEAPPLPESQPGSVPDYIADLCAGMIKMAEAADHGLLAYLLGMAQIEAERLGNQQARSGDDTRKRRKNA